MTHVTFSHSKIAMVAKCTSDPACVAPSNFFNDLLTIVTQTEPWLVHPAGPKGKAGKMSLH